MRKRMTVLMLLSLLILLFSGCGQENVEEAVIELFQEPQYDWEKGRGQTLTIWGQYPDLDRGYIRKAFERYRKLTGNDLNVVQLPKEQFEDQLMSAFQSKTSAPDVVLSYGGTSLESFHPDENFYDFTNALWVEDLTNTAINQTVYNGKIIGLPHWEASISGTLYNKDLFKKYHLSVPRTQSEFIEVCDVLLEKGVIPLYLPGKEISMLLYQFPLDTIVEEPSVLKGLNEGLLGYKDLPEMSQVLDWYRTMAQKGYLGESYQTDDWDGMSSALSSGKYAMMLCWDTWLYTDFKGNPEQFGLMPAFMGVPENGTFEGPNLALFLVNKNTTQLSSAINFITFLADPYNYNNAFEGVYTAPVFKNQVASISTPQYLEAERLIERNFRDSTAWLRIRGFSQMDASLILEYMNSNGSMTAPECLEQMDRLRRKRLKR